MSYHDEFSYRVPSDVEREDRILAGLTARQVAILGAAAAALWLAFIATRHLVPLPVFAVFAFPFGAASAVLALGRRDGFSLDRLLLAAVRQRRAPRTQVLAPEGVPPTPSWIDAPPGRLPTPLRLPATAISADGVIDLGSDGVAVICVASTVSFALRTPQEQSALVGAFGRWLNSLAGPVQIVARAEAVDLGPLIFGLRSRAPNLPDPALERAALEHAEFLADLVDRRDLLRRQVLIVLREPRHGATRLGQRDAGAELRVLRRVDEAVRALSTAEITVRILPGGEAASALAACGNPWRAAPASSGAPSDIITGSFE